MSEKVELNKIFEVKKGKITSRWKLIKHPYFEDCLTLVRDYCGKYGEMKNGKCEEDYNHMSGMTTLKKAYKDAFYQS